MQTEKRRKFLVADLSVLDGQQGFPIMQGYLSEGCSLVEVRTFGSFAFLTIGGKQDRSPGDRFEYPIPLEDALAMLECHCASHYVSKTRHLIPHGGEVLEVDVFGGKLAGLVIAEVPPGAQSEAFAPPGWFGPEVTSNPDFDDFALAHRESAPTAVIPAKSRE